MALTLLAGLLLTGIVSGIAYRVWGEPAAIAAAVFGAIALAIQLAALGLLRPVRGRPSSASSHAGARGWGSVCSAC